MWVDAPYLDSMLGSSILRQRLFSVDGVFSSDALEQYEVGARATVVSYLLFAGYSDPGETIDTTQTSGAFLADLCAALMVSRAFARTKGIQWPPGLADSVEASLAALEDIREKRLPVPGLSPSTVAGYGGVSGSRTTGPDARVNQFAVSRLRGW